MSTTTENLPPPLPGRTPAAKRTGDYVAYDEFIERHLASTGRHVKVTDTARAWIAFAIFALAYFFAVAVVDAWLVSGGLGSTGRWIVAGLFLVAMAVFLYRQALPLLLRRIHPLYAAQTIESHQPSLKNALLNALFLREQGAPVPRQVYQLVEEQAAVSLTRVVPGSSVDRTPLIRLGYVLLAVVVVWCVYQVASPRNPWRTLARVAAPWADIPAPTRVRILEVEPGDTQALRGERIPVRVRVDGATDQDTVQVVYTSADGQYVRQEAPLFRQLENSWYACEFPPEESGLQDDVTYYLQAGDARTGNFNIEVLVAPTITVDNLRLQPPAYTGLPSRALPSQGDLRALEGTRVELEALANQPIAQAWLEREGLGKLEMTFEQRQAQTEFTLRLPTGNKAEPFAGTYTLRFRNSEGEINPRPATYALEVIPDYPPSTEFLAPLGKEHEVPHNRSLDLELRAWDPDFALTKIALRISVAEEERESVLLLQEPREGTYLRTWSLVPAEVGLAPGDEAEVWLTAWDNREPRTNENDSDRRLLIRVLPPVSEPGQEEQPQDQQGDGSQQQTGEGGQQQESGEGGQGQAGDSSPTNGDAVQQPPPEGAADNQQPDDQQESAVNDQPPDGSPEGENGQQTSPGETGRGEKGSPAGDQGEAEAEGSSGQPGDKEDQPQTGDQAEQNGDAESQPEQEQPGSSSSEGGASQPGQSQQPGERSPTEQSSGSERRADTSPEVTNDGDAFDIINDHFQEQEGSSPPGEEPRPQDASGDASSQQESSPGENSDDSSQEPRNGEADAQQSAGEERTAQEQNTPGERGSSSGQSEGAQGQSSQEGVGESAQPGTPQPSADQPGERQPSGRSDAGSNSQAAEDQPAGSERQAEAQPEPGERSAEDSDRRPSDTEQPVPGQPRTEQEQPQTPNSGVSGGQGKNSSGGTPRSDGTPTGEQGPDPGGSPGETTGQRAPDGAARGVTDREPREGDGEGRASRPATDSSDPQHRASDGGAGQPENTASKEQETRPGEAQPSQGESERDTPGAGRRQGTPQDQASEQRGTPGENGQPREGDASSGSVQERTPGENASRPGDGATSTNQQPASRTPGQPPAGSEAAGSRPGSGERAQPGERTSPPPNAESGASGNGGGGPNGQNVPPEQQTAPLTEPGADDANLDYARRATDFALDRLKDQLSEENPDPELLRKLGWSRDQLRQFVQRWEQLKSQAREPAAQQTGAQRELDTALRRLGLQPRGASRDRGQTEQDEDRDLRRGRRIDPPRKWSEAFRIFTQSRSSSDDGK